MIKEETTLRQGISMIVMFIIGSTAILGSVNEAEKDSWLAIIAGVVIAIPILLIYARLKKLQPDMDLYDMLLWTLGNILGKICIALFAWYALHLGALVIRNITEFLEAMALPATPQFVSALILGLLTIWAVRSGLQTLGTWSIIFVIVVVVIFAITLLAGISQYDFNNIKPIAEKGLGKLIEGGTSSFSFPFAETVIFLLALGAFKAGTSPYKVWFIGLAIGAAVNFTASLRNLLILGEQIYVGRYYSSYTAAMVITFSDFFSRFEIIIGANFLLCGFVKITMCLLAACKGVAKLFGLADHKKLAAPMGLWMMVFALTVYSSMTEMFDWLFVYKYYALPFQVILPVIVWIIAEIKVKLSTALNRYAKEKG